MISEAAMTEEGRVVITVSSVTYCGGSASKLVSVVGLLCYLILSNHVVVMGGRVGATAINNDVSSPAAIAAIYSADPGMSGGASGIIGSIVVC